MKSRIFKGLAFVLLAVALIALCVGAGAEQCAPTEHSLTSTVTKETTCTTNGERTWSCSKCDYSFVEPIMAVGHDYEWVTDVKSTCVVYGIRHQVCKKCGLTGATENMPLAAHTEPSDWTIVTAPTCTQKGLKEKRCTVCSVLLASEEIPMVEHKTTEKIKQSPTCTVNGIKQIVCTVCNGVITDNISIPALGHDLGDWNIKTAPTCTTAGVKERACNRCSYVETESIPAIGHNMGSWITTKEATCTENGTKERSCTNSGCTYKETESIPATGHNYGPYTQTVAPTCTAPGKEVATCTNKNCTATLERSIPAKGHSWGDWTTTKEPTCTAAGSKERTCLNGCGEKQTESVPALGHDWGEWQVITPATLTSTGLRQHTCKRCGATESEEIPMIRMTNNTMCAIGPRLRDQNIYDEWFMFTPFDASEDGVQTFDLVASNKYIVGKLTLTVKDGYITVDYNVPSNKLDITLEFFTILNSIDDINQYYPEELYDDYAMHTRRKISIEEELGGDTKLVLYFCSRVNYYYDANHMTGLRYESAPVKNLVNSMLALMD